MWMTQHRGHLHPGCTRDQSPDFIETEIYFDVCLSVCLHMSVSVCVFRGLSGPA